MTTPNQHEARRNDKTYVSRMKEVNVVGGVGSKPCLHAGLILILHTGIQLALLERQRRVHHSTARPAANQKHCCGSELFVQSAAFQRDTESSKHSSRLLALIKSKCIPPADLENRPAV